MSWVLDGYFEVTQNGGRIKTHSSCSVIFNNLGGVSGRVVDDNIVKLPKPQRLRADFVGFACFVQEDRETQGSRSQGKHYYSGPEVRKRWKYLEAK